MGGILARNTGESQVVEISTNNAYRYPPKAGAYFSNYFIMGGEKFDMPQPESYLFGENDDLNFIGSRPSPFPYPNNQSSEPTKMLKSLVNIRKSSLRFIRTAEPTGKADDDPMLIEDHMTRYNVEFTFDTDIKCAITIYYFATEEILNGKIVYHPRDASMNSETYSYKQGANQVFSQSSHVIDPSKFNEQDWQYDNDNAVIPVVIQCVVEDDEHVGHSHMTFATVDISADQGYLLKPLKQKQFINGVPFLLQEIYGIENKTLEKSKDPDDDIDETGAECIICMSEMRDTLILPCRHLCLCSTCAESLRYQSSYCPICRSNFRALLQLRAMRKKQPLIPRREGEREETAVSQVSVPAGYEAVSLFEALNGPSMTSNNTQDSTITRSARSDKGDKKRSLKRYHSGETRAHERPATITTEAETLPAETQAVRSPTHSNKKNHPPHSRHGVKPSDKRGNKNQSNENTTDRSTENLARDLAAYKTDDLDPAADDADDEQSSDEEAYSHDARQKTVSPDADRNILTEKQDTDSDSQGKESIEMVTVDHKVYTPVTTDGSTATNTPTTPSDKALQSGDIPIPLDNANSDSHSNNTNDDAESMAAPDTSPADTPDVTVVGATDMSSLGSTESQKGLLPPTV